jgi:serine/threonine protein kinase
MGPQQASAELIDHRADQFSLAVVLYELVARRRLLADCTPARTLGRILYTDLPSVQDVTQGLPADVAATIDRALSRNPEDRYENCAAFAAALRDALVRYESCEDESYEALLGHLTTRCVEPEALPLAARVSGPARARRWVVMGDHTELAFAA